MRIEKPHLYKNIVTWVDPTKDSSLTDLSGNERNMILYGDAPTSNPDKSLHFNGVNNYGVIDIDNQTLSLCWRIANKTYNGKFYLSRTKSRTDSGYFFGTWVTGFAIAFYPGGFKYSELLKTNGVVCVSSNRFLYTDIGVSDFQYPSNVSDGIVIAAANRTYCECDFYGIVAFKTVLNEEDFIWVRENMF